MGSIHRVLTVAFLAVIIESAVACTPANGEAGDPSESLSTARKHSKVCSHPECHTLARRDVSLGPPMGGGA